MPTVTINGVKHTPGSNTLKKMRKAEAAKAQAKPKAVALAKPPAKTPAAKAPAQKKPPIPATKSNDMILKTNVGKRATEPTPTAWGGQRKGVPGTAWGGPKKGVPGTAWGGGGKPQKSDAPVPRDKPGSVQAQQDKADGSGRPIGFSRTRYKGPFG